MLDVFANPERLCFTSLDNRVHPEIKRIAQNMRVWIVEDNRADAFLIEMGLARTGRPVEKTLMRDGEAAIRKIRACQTGASPVPDLLILDISLPGFDGVDVLRALRETPVFDPVAIVVFSSSPVVDGGFGVNRLLQKPTNLEQFLNDISRTVLELLPAEADSLSKPSECQSVQFG